ncbi:lamin tail domain-containing protein [Telluribacter humicola]|uniref:lamin tail domain-containing protein n=1 Tax=Telluribacter humicola TaxID=1720261 RepID=UPI001A97906A|nr:lamin tail domain-containing protein [Telluribacter humicola]
MIKRLLPVLLLTVILPYAYGQGYNSVVVSEVMADPTPVVGLPDAEYIELYNRSQQPLLLRGWRLIMGNRSAVFPDSVLAPGQYAVVCGRASLSLLSTYGKTIALSSVTLPNDGATLALRNAQGQLVYAVTYSLNWWPSDRRQGGYAIEMVDKDNPCGEVNNWRVSSDPRGGTPGTTNSVKASNPDLRPPTIERVDIATVSQITIQFSERLDSLSTIQAAAFTLSGRQIIDRTLDTPDFCKVTLTLDAPLQEQQSYELTVRNIADCAGNLLREERRTLGLPTRADSGDVVLSEILFNPRSGGVDFVEIYNRTSSYFNLKNWALGNSSAGQPATLRPLTTDDLLLAPNEYLAFTTDPALVQEHYPSDRPRRLLRVPSLPSFPNTEGGVVLLDQEGRLFDRFDYQENYHSPLLGSREGVSLERMYYDRPANTPSNWHSAASTVGYATPGYANSQGVREEAQDGFVVEPEAFTPDGDGMDDYVAISYTLSAAGQVATIRIFDLSGRLIKNLVQNQLIGTYGDVRWDGTNERGEAVRMGYYLLLIDTFDATGNTRQYKKRVVVVRR